MKTPQRKFVVEFKSPRRQSKTRTNSIWGDTDLKALAREVEDQSPGLTSSDKTQEMVSAGKVTLPAQVDMGSSDKTAGNVEAAKIVDVPANDLKTDELPGVNAGHLEVVSAAATQKTLNTPEARTISKRASKRRIGRRQPPVSEDVVQAARPEVAVEAIVDEIAELDAENKRLKQLLVEHLRDQNLALKQMLERFDLS